LPSPEQLEYALVLLRRAESDARACRALAADDAMADDVVGFHAQQAVEKALKAVLVLNGLEFPRTHDLDFLLAHASEHGVRTPEELVDAGWLSPWAAQLRYDEPAGELDRTAAVAAAEASIAWAAATVTP
jgi:HEPN domain-containing protein